MYDSDTRGIDFPITSDFEVDAEKSDAVEFRCPPNYDAVFAPPIGATAHIEENRANYQYQVGLSQSVKELRDDPDVKGGLSTGWIVSVPERFHISIIPDEVRQGGQIRNDFIRGWGRWQPSPDAPGKTIVFFRIEWSPSVEDGYSLLITDSGIHDYEEFTVFSHVIDADAFDQYLDIPVLFHTDGKFEFKHGHPFARVIPINRDVMRAETSFLPPEETSPNARDSNRDNAE